MRYTESKDQSTALLRQALASMGQHDAALNPLCFAVFYELAAGINPRLNAAFTQAVSLAPRLNDDAVRTLYQDHVAEAGLGETQRIQADMQRVMTDIVQSATRTGQAAGAFDDRLEGLSGALAGNDTQALQSNIEAARESTQAMRDSVKALQDQVSASQREIDSLRADLMRTREEATVCPLTRVLNRRGFDERLGQMLQAPPPAGSAHCLIMLDIDHFKRVNDTHGHLAGDECLRVLSRKLADTVFTENAVVARFGGEEFVVALPACGQSRLLEIAERLRRRVGAEPVHYAGKEITITASIGAFSVPPGWNHSADDVLHHVDDALYAAKNGGRNRVQEAAIKV